MRIYGVYVLILILSTLVLPDVVTKTKTTFWQKHFYNNLFPCPKTKGKYSAQKPSCNRAFLKNETFFELIPPGGLFSIFLWSFWHPSRPPSAFTTLARTFQKNVNFVRQKQQRIKGESRNSRVRLNERYYGFVPPGRSFPSSRGTF